MSTVLVVLGTAWIALVGLLVLVLLVQVLAGWRLRAQPQAGGERVPSYAVVMPAHDEAGTIAGPIAAVGRPLAPGARLLVVADNCSDTTADEARAAGAQVVERQSPIRGKGHALAFGVAQLAADPPDVVIVIDADCIPADGALDRLATAAQATGRPAQALYLMLAPAGSSLRLRMAAFAWAVRNQVRALGMHRLGLPCPLMGSGMAFPWACVASGEFASGHLAEDQQLGLKLASEGRAPRMCPGALVEGWFPQEGAALDSQRKRWEHGHLSLLAGVPAMLWRALCRRNLGALALAVDLCIPPLALLALLLLAACAVGALLVASGWPGGRLAGGLALAALSSFALAALLAWASVGRRWLRLSELASVPLYIVKKLPVYAGFVVRRQKEWVRTSRQR